MRDSNQYRKLLHRFDLALEEVWPYCFDDAKECYRISNNSKDIEQLMLDSHLLMKYIRAFLKKKKLSYEENHTIPNICTAIENTVAAVNKTSSLAVEASALEIVSRACYRWLKENKYIINTISNNTTTTTTNFWCQCCKTYQADEDGLCEDCGLDTPSIPGPFADIDKKYPLLGGDMLFSTFRNLMM